MYIHYSICTSLRWSNYSCQLIKLLVLVNSKFTTSCAFSFSKFLIYYYMTKFQFYYSKTNFQIYFFSITLPFRWVVIPSFNELIWRKLCMLHIICANIFANIKLRDDNRHTWDHIEEVFIRTIKCLNNPLGGWQGPQIFVYVPRTQRIQSQLSFMMVSQLASLANKYKRIHRLREFLVSSIKVHLNFP